MIGTIIPATSPEDPGYEQMLQSLGHSRLLIETNLRQWLKNAGQRLTYTRMEEGQDPKIMCCFERQDTAFAFHALELSEYLVLYRSYPTMPEETFSSDSSDGYTPDKAWFEQRDSALGIKWNHKFESFMIPPRSVAKLTLSYVVSSAGMIRFEKQLVPWDGYIPKFVIQVEAIFLGKDTVKGWVEKFYLEPSKLERFMDARI